MRPMIADRYLVTCEHGGNEVPQRYRELFAGSEALLHTHRGFDPGALAMAEALAAALGAPLVASTTTRLLIDLNRSLGSPRLYSEMSRRAPPAVRRDILALHYQPYRSDVEQRIDAEIAAGHRVVHIGSHSFAPELDGAVRHADVGLLYDPARAGELTLCRHWEAALAQLQPALRVRRNYPYAGTADGLTTAMRRKFPADAYLGIELEINQRFILQDIVAGTAVREAVITALEQAIANPVRKGA